MSTDPFASADLGFTEEQRRYLEGFFAGVKARGVTFGDIAPAPAAPAASKYDDFTKEERIKRELHPLDATEQLIMDARGNLAPEAENNFRHRWNGLFWLSPSHNAYMCRLRIPGGVVRSNQLRALASISRELTTGYIQLTTRNNFQIRNIEPKDCPEVLRRIQACGLHSRGSGGDNLRNFTMSPAAGVDPHELIDVRPYIDELAHLVISGREFYDLPRKFNVAYDGGGSVSVVEDTNDIGATAVEIMENDRGILAGVWFRIGLGGVTGHKTFTTDADILVAPDQLTSAVVAIIRVFIREGDRTNRKKARLKYVLERMGIPAFVAEVEKLLPFKFARLPEGELTKPRRVSQQEHAHVGVFPQTQPGLFRIGVAVPVGQMTPKQLDQVADIAETHASGEVRLTVWQNFIIPNVPGDKVDAVCKAIGKIGFETKQSHLRSGFVACTGNRYCKYSSADTKGHAVTAMEYLDTRVKLDRPVTIHFTGCAHSCAQHFMGDIGMLSTKIGTGPAAEEGYHITVGGGFGENRAVGRQIFSGVSARSLPRTLETMLKAYLANRTGDETFHAFCNRHTVGRLQELFSA
jgi:ferredoxin-nitrite reductase